MQQQRNLLIFFILAFALMVGAMQLRQRFWPAQQPAPQPEKKDEVVKKTPAEPKKPDAEQPANLPPQPNVTPDDKLIPLGDRSGDSKFHLFVLLDPLGGGVRTVVLNKFQQATEGGLPVRGEQLSLVPGGPNLQHPSYLILAYPPDDTKIEHPLDTLGRIHWTVVKQNGKAVHVEEVDGKEKQTVSFRAESQGVTITKTFSLTAGEYHLGLTVDLERPKARPDAKASDKREVKFRYQLTGAKGLPVEGRWYTSTYRNALLALEDDRGGIYRDLQDLREISLWAGGNPVEKKDGRFLRYAGVGVQYFASVIAVDADQPDQAFLRRAQATLETAVARGKVKGAALARPDRMVMVSDDGKTETTIFLPPALRDELIGAQDGTPVAVVYRPLSFNTNLKETYNLATSIALGSRAAAVHPLWEDDITVRVVTEAVPLAPGGKATHHYLLYNGPIKPRLLGQFKGTKAEVDPAVIDRYVDTLKLNTLTDYHSPGRMGEFANAIYWTRLVILCTNLMHTVLGFLHWFVPSFGLCIILLTVLVRGLMFPLSRKQALMGMRMQELAPELKKLQVKYKDDKQALGMAQWDLYRKHGVSPFGSCWVMLLQMPIFMGLYYALQESILFRLAPFWPTWIKNLAAPDMLWRWGESIPLLSRPEDFGGFLYLGPYLNLLPIIAVSLMIVQQKMMMPPPADEQQEMQQKMMKWMMVFFGLMFYKVAAGLCIYFIASSVWGFAERKLLPKAKPKVGGDADQDGAELTAGAPTVAAASTAVTAPSGVTVGKRAGRNKRKAERGRITTKQEEPSTGFGRFRQRLTNWWSDLLEQAKKK
jgi:YidC/Oxa1 family membrane protein insertase